MEYPGDATPLESNDATAATQAFTVAAFLRPRYRTILRYQRKRPHLLRLSSNLSLLSCFAISLCIAACMYKWVDEICESDSVKEKLLLRDSSPNGRLSLSILRAILEQRGVFTDQPLERNELDSLLALTGDITPEELVAADRTRAQLENFKASQSPDTVLHQKVVSSSWDPYTDSGETGAESIVFDSESAFVERVDDNKDSVWLLAVVANGVNTLRRPDVDAAYTDSVITSEVWGHLVHRYSSFGFKLGLIDCHRLRSLCHDRGFVAADLVLALPKGGDRIKDSLQFRPYPRQPIHPTGSKATFPTTQIVRHVRRWLSSVLSERIHRIDSVSDLLPPAFQLVGSETRSKILRFSWMSWLRRRPQPVQVIWSRNMSAVRRSNQLSKLWEDYANPPMVLSALSVPYTGRVRFSVITTSVGLQASKQVHMSSHHGSISHSSVESPIDLLDAFGCPKDTSFLILTPEGSCIAFGAKAGEYLSYSNLELHLRFLYPSADDFLLILAILVNLLVILNSSVEAGKWFACLIRYSMGVASPLPSTPATTRLRMAQSIVRLARRGWTSHTISQVRDEQMEDMDESTLSTPSIQRIMLWKRFITFVQCTFLEFISSNFLLLIAVLPLINLLSLPQTAFLLNSSLWLLRRLVTFSPLVTFRLSVAAGHMTLFRLSFVTFWFWAFCSAVVAHVYLVLWSCSSQTLRSRGHRRSASARLLQRIHDRSPHEFLNELSRLLLAVSDVEDRIEQTSSSASSTATTDADNMTVTGDMQDLRNRLISNSRIRREEGLDQTRLLTQLTRLHRLLNSEDSVINSPIAPPATPEVVDTDDAGRPGSAPVAAPAHIYTWQCAQSARVSTAAGEPSLSPVPTLGSRKSENTLRDELDSSLQGSTSGAAAHPLPRLDADYEAEDEADEFECTIPQRLSAYRRPRFRRPRLPLRPSTDSHSSTATETSDTDIRADEAFEDSTGTPANLCTNWPPWVIPCEACVICWRKFRPHVRLGALPCGHGFHEACIRRWLDTGALDCPVCRWPAHAPHLRQQRQMLGQLLTAVHTSLNATRQQHPIESS